MHEERIYCRICEAACGLVAEVNGQGRVTRLRPDKEHPSSQGYVCAKGTRFHETAGHRRRLTAPLARQADGTYRTIGWDAALTAFGAQVKPIVDRYGPHAVGVYYGNPLLFNALGLVSVLNFKRVLGTRNLFSSFSQDCNNKFAGAEIVHSAALKHPLPDLGRAKLALLFGSNPAVSQGSFVHLAGGASAFDRFATRGGEAIWVDPRRSESAGRWGEHLAIRPGSDIFLLLALLHEVRDLHRPATAAPGMHTLLNLAAQYPASRAATLTGLPAEQIASLADRIRRSSATTFHMSVGVNQGLFGTLAYVALQALAFLTGNFDAPGGVLFHPLANPLSALLERLGIGTDPAPSRVGGLTGVFDELPGGVLADEILTPGPEQIRVLLVIGGNPIRSIPGSQRLARALDQLDYLVHVDIFPDETVPADLRLPATTWLERWDVATTPAVFQTGSLLPYAPPVQEPPGLARPERRIMADLSLALDRPLFRRHRLARWWGQKPIDRWLGRALDVLSAPLRPFRGGARGLPSPKVKAGHYRSRHAGGAPRFWHRRLDGEPARLATYAVAEEAPGSGFRLLSRRRRLGHNSWLHGGVVDGRTEAAAWLAPEDAQALCVAKGDPITLSANGTRIVLPVIPRDGVAPGTVVVPHGLPEANVNALIPSGPEHVEPVSGNHHMTGIRVEIEPSG